MALTVEGLTCVRGGRTVLADLSFTVADGEALILRGPNGAGKSTLLRALAGLLPSTGRIRLDGDPDPDARVDAIAYAGHLDAVKSQLTVAENLAFWAGLFGGDAAIALDGFALDTIADRPVHLCSAGQRRRLGLARLLLAPRRIWLLDEPTVSLDAAAEARLVAAIARHLAGGGAAVIATHAPLDLAPARRLDLAAATAAASDPFIAGAWT